MNLRRDAVLAVLASFLAFCAPNARGAQTVLPNSDPGIPGEGFVTYVGNYGEVFKLRGGWKIDASMHGATEVINQYPPFRNDLDDSIEPFTAGPSDFAPENFTRLALIQLLVIPRSAAATPFDQLKRLKIADLQASHVEFKIVDNPFYGGFEEKGWPAGTFEVFISTPYRLTQLYVTSNDYLCILTAGRDTPPSSVISSHYDWMRSGLRDWIVPTGLGKPPSAGLQTFLNHWRNGKSIRILTKPAVLSAWALMSGLCLVLAAGFSLSGRAARIRQALVMILIFSHAGAAIGAFTGTAMWAFPWPSDHMPFAAVIAALFIPLLAAAAKRIRGGNSTSASILWIAAWALLCSAGFLFLSVGARWGPVFSPVIPIDTAIAMFFAYGIGGMILGVATPGSGKS